MGILSDIEDTLIQTDNSAHIIAVKDIRRQARAFIKIYCQYGDIKNDLYWDDYVIDNNIWGDECISQCTLRERVKRSGYQMNSSSYKINFRAINPKTSKIDTDPKSRLYSFDNVLIEGPVTNRYLYEFHHNSVSATTFECDHDVCDNIVFTPKTNTYPIVIKGYGSKLLPEWMLFERSKNEQDGLRRVITKKNHLSFLLINCNLTEQEIRNHVIDIDNTDLHIDIINTF